MLVVSQQADGSRRVLDGIHRRPAGYRGRRKTAPGVAAGLRPCTGTARVLQARSSGCMYSRCRTRGLPQWCRTISPATACWNAGAPADRRAPPGVRNAHPMVTPGICDRLPAARSFQI
ncbi:hypothetical protein GCM10009850_119590 [Nonomuraea monospora]|uniref:Uncharacterized protein n=1 Tax=Nonomuraea monospora TaxID=568818 RepID=A0ABN3D432_9ACTN